MSARKQPALALRREAFGKLFEALEGRRLFSATHPAAPFLVAPGTIQGIAFVDANGNGKQDSGEKGLAGVDVFAGSAAFGVTAADGSYSFSVAPGSYFVYASTPSGYSETTASSSNVNVTAGQTSTVNFGEEKTGAAAGKSIISGTVYNDANGNGKQDSGDSGVKGVTISLTLASQASGANVPAATTTMTTDASGNYRFTGLVAGEYKIAETVPTGDTQTEPASGGYDRTVGLSGSQISSGNDFGIKANSVGPVTHFVSGTVFNDANDDGKQDNGETGLKGVSVTLTPAAAGNNVSAHAATTLKTDSSGKFDFTGVANGNYTLTETVLAGYKQTVPASGGYSFLLEDQSGISGELFGQFKAAVPPPPSPAKISGTVFNDANADGKKETSESGLANVSVTLTPSAVQGNNVPAAATTIKTDSSGNYSFTGLAAGTYTVTEAVLSGYQQTLPAGGGFTVTLTAGQTVTGELFGQHKTAVVPPPQTGTISGELFNDDNGDGKIGKTDGPTGVRTVFLDTNGNGRLDAGETSVKSDKNGTYKFTGLAAGTYKVSRLFPAGYHLSDPSSGTGGNDVLVTVAAGGAATANLGTYHYDRTATVAAIALADGR